MTPETRRREREDRRRDLIARLIDSYLNEPDAEYAEAFYGELLAEHGLTTGDRAGPAWKAVAWTLLPGTNHIDRAVWERT